MKKYKVIWDRCWAWICSPLIKWLNRRLERDPDDKLANNAANGITVLRGVVMTYLVYGLALAEPGHRGTWLIIMFFTQLTDGADGAVARGTGTTGDLGSALDGGVDKYSALLLLGTLILWIRSEYLLALQIYLATIFVVIVVAEVRCIRANKSRQAICEELSKEFSSRLPAQIKFMATMLILGSCWLVTDPRTAATIFLLGLPVICGLTIWSAQDYERDRQNLLIRSYDLRNA